MRAGSSPRLPRGKRGQATLSEGSPTTPDLNGSDLNGVLRTHFPLLSGAGLSSFCEFRATGRAGEALGPSRAYRGRHRRPLRPARTSHGKVDLPLRLFWSGTPEDRALARELFNLNIPTERQ